MTQHIARLTGWGTPAPATPPLPALRRELRRDPAPVYHAIVCETCGERSDDERSEPGEQWALQHAAANPGHAEFRQDVTWCWTAVTHPPTTNPHFGRRPPGVGGSA